MHRSLLARSLTRLLSVAERARAFVIPEHRTTPATNRVLTSQSVSRTCRMQGRGPANCSVEPRRFDRLENPVDFASYFVDTAALAVAVAAVVAFIKTNLLKNLHGLATVAVSLAIGAILGVAGHFLGSVEGGILPAVAFGVAAGFLASGGWDAVKGVLSKPREG